MNDSFKIVLTIQNIWTLFSNVKIIGRFKHFFCLFGKSELSYSSLHQSQHHYHWLHPNVSDTENFKSIVDVVRVKNDSMKLLALLLSCTVLWNTYMVRTKNCYSWEWARCNTANFNEVNRPSPFSPENW